MNNVSSEGPEKDRWYPLLCSGMDPLRLQQEQLEETDSEFLPPSLNVISRRARVQAVLGSLCVMLHFSLLVLWVLNQE